MATETKKANSIITTSIPNPEDTFEVTIKLPKVLRFKVLDQGDVDLDLPKVSKENVAYAVIHGFGQRIPDAAAIGTTDKDGMVIPKAERTRIKFEKMNEVCVHYESGTAEWDRRAESGGGGSRSLTLEAIAKVKGVEYAEAERLAQVHADMHFEGDRKKALAHLATGKRVAEAMSEIRAERDLRKAGTVSVDADEALEELKAGPAAEPEAEEETADAE